MTLVALESTTDTSAEPPAKSAKPFLKWAGGKRQLLPHIRQFYPATFGAYHEPFVGSGAVFFDLYSAGLLSDHRVWLIDNNADLIGCYLMVRDRIEAVIRNLAKLARDYQRDPKAHYYRVRDEHFNPQRKRIFNGGGPRSAEYTPPLAASLIYLNRTGFNGLFRLNSKNLFNVPIGRYANPLICDRQNLRAVSTALANTKANILRAGFDTVLEHAHPNDFLYFDPPYAPLSRTALFTSYTATGFSRDDQKRLQEVVVELSRRGCWVLLSNSTAPEIAELYDGNPSAEAAGLTVFKVPARRAINSKASERGEVMEYLITNIPRRAAE